MVRLIGIFSKSVLAIYLNVLISWSMLSMTNSATIVLGLVQSSTANVCSLIGILVEEG